MILLQAYFLRSWLAHGAACLDLPALAEIAPPDLGSPCMLRDSALLSPHSHSPTSALAFVGPYLPIQVRNTPTAAQIVSCSPSRQHVVPVTSSTRFIRHPRGLRSSNHAWKLPSSCTKSPKCSRRSQRFRCAFRLRIRLHNPPPTSSVAASPPPLPTHLPPPNVPLPA
jgi:hypothetical protein